ncbi:hypothetical protein FQN57_006440 [Myotisia sp. PD_48]|nr:hypothetical protein FQN57_006440 [Myotisia sp. PD_48]
MSEIPCPESLVTLMSHRPPRLVTGMISIAHPAKMTTVDHRPSVTPLGLLNALPIELMHYICNMLDFQSLSRLLRTSLRVRSMVESLPAYRDLMEHAPDTLTALGETQLISLHSADLLYKTLRSQHCVSCLEFGPFLFLPRCERCCHDCLRANPALWVMPIAFAKECFRFSPKEMKKLPIMRSIPGVYEVGHEISRNRQLKLVSVRAAKEMALRFHGSLPKAASYTDRWYIEAPSNPMEIKPSLLPGAEIGPYDSSCGLASILFPCLLSKNTIENGIWCKGCDWTFLNYRSGKLSRHLINDMLPPGLNPIPVLSGMRRRAWSKDELLVHIKQCYGARKLLHALNTTEINEVI